VDYSTEVLLNDTVVALGFSDMLFCVGITHIDVIDGFQFIHEWLKLSFGIDGLDAETGKVVHSENVVENIPVNLACLMLGSTASSIIEAARKCTKERNATYLDDADTQYDVLLLCDQFSWDFDLVIDDWSRLLSRCLAFDAFLCFPFILSRLD